MEIKEVITSVYSDELTGIQVLEDIRGDFHFVSIGDSSSMSPGEHKFLQSVVKTTWPSVDDFNRIPDIFNAGEFLDYTVPASTQFSIRCIIAAQDGNSLSTIGLFLEDTIKMIVPIRESVYHSFYDPITLAPGTNLSVRFFPAGKGVELSINIGGHLTPLS